MPLLTRWKSIKRDVKGVSHGALSSRLLKRERKRAAALITFSKHPAPHISLLRLACYIKGGHVFWNPTHLFKKEVKTYSNSLPWKGARLNADSLERAPKTFSNQLQKSETYNTALRATFAGFLPNECQTLHEKSWCHINAPAAAAEQYLF
jgi:hypothetical protein